jgi:hypothetical protein
LFCAALAKALHRPGQLVHVDALPALIGRVGLAEELAVFGHRQRAEARTVLDIDAVDVLAGAGDLAHVDNLAAGAHLPADGLLHLAGEVLVGQALAVVVTAHAGPEVGRIAARPRIIAEPPAVAVASETLAGLDHAPVGVDHDAVRLAAIFEVGDVHRLAVARRLHDPVEIVGAGGAKQAALHVGGKPAVTDALPLLLRVVELAQERAGVVEDRHAGLAALGHGHAIVCPVVARVLNDLLDLAATVHFGADGLADLAGQVVELHLAAVAAPVAFLHFVAAVDSIAVAVTDLGVGVGCQA